MTENIKGKVVVITGASSGGRSRSHRNPEQVPDSFSDHLQWLLPQR